jgi:20S proteasome alpha/beta subunit
MTIAAGLVCDGGIVLCVDSQETYGDLKWPVDKLSMTRKYGYPIMIAGAGHGPGIDAATQRIIEKVEGGYTDPSVYVHFIQEILRDIHANDLPNHPDARENPLTFELLIAFHVPEFGSFLYKTSGSLVSRVKYFEVIGSGVLVNYFAHALYRRSPFNRPEMSISEGRTLAAFLAYQAKRQLSSVGGRSVLAAMDDKGEIEYAREWEVPQWEQFFGEFQWEQGQLMLASVNPSVPSVAYSKWVDDFAAKMKERKLQLLKDTQDWENIFRPYSPEESAESDNAPAEGDGQID